MSLQGTSYCQFIDEEAKVQKKACPNYKTSKGKPYDLKPNLVELKFKCFPHLSQKTQGREICQTNLRRKTLSNITAYGSIFSFLTTNTETFSSSPFYGYALRVQHPPQDS